MKLYACLTLLLLTSAISAVAGTDLTGNWREISRKVDGKELSFSDTMFFEFRIGNEWQRQKKNSYLYRGVYKINSNLLDLGTLVYTIDKWTDNRLVIHDDNGTYELTRFTPQQVNPAATNSSAASSGRANEPVVPSLVHDLQDLSGKWQSFKRTSASSQSTMQDKRLIRTVIIYPKTLNGRMGEVYSINDMDGKPSEYIAGYSNNKITTNGKTPRELYILRYADGELVIKEGDVTYFFKQL